MQGKIFSSHNSPNHFLTTEKMAVKLILVVCMQQSLSLQVSKFLKHYVVLFDRVVKSCDLATIEFANKPDSFPTQLHVPLKRHLVKSLNFVAGVFLKIRKNPLLSPKNPA